MGFIRNFFVFILLTVFLFISCNQPETIQVDTEDENQETNGPEVFDQANKPVFEYNAADDSYLLQPWNYEKAYNSSRTYPLVVYLHGSGSSGDPAAMAMGHLGYNNDGFKKDYPSFVYIPHTSGSWNNSRLISQIENLKNTYRINTNRIYLVGYSMGGSGSYALANAYYDYNGHLFAGIIRLAGQSQTSVRNLIASKTSIWLHIGLNDTATRVTVTRDAYQFLKTFHSDAAETSSTVTITNHPGTTLTLTKNNMEIVKKTEYDNDGHGVSNFPFRDPYLIQWLFNQDLGKR